MRLFQSYFQTLCVIWQFANLEEPNELLVFPRLVCERFFCSDEFRKRQPHQQPKIPAKSKKDWTNNFSIIFAWEAMKMSLILLESVGSSAAVLQQCWAAVTNWINIFKRCFWVTKNNTFCYSFGLRWWFFFGGNALYRGSSKNISSPPTKKIINKEPILRGLRWSHPPRVLRGVICIEIRDVGNKHFNLLITLVS